MANYTTTDHNSTLPIYLGDLWQTPKEMEFKFDLPNNWWPNLAAKGAGKVAAFDAVWGKAKAAAKTVVIGKTKLYQSAVEAAITLLTDSADPRVKTILKTAGSPLEHVDFTSLVAEVRAYRSDLKTHKAAVIAFLQRAIDSPGWAGPFRRDADTYYLIPPLLALDVDPDLQDPAALRRLIRAISTAIGNPRLVGRGVSKMDQPDLRRWLTSWFRGDLGICYELEAAVTTPHPYHPGHPERGTATVVWAPAVAGEVPAAATVPGDWPSPYQLSGDAVGNYLIAAKAQNVGHMSTWRRQSWVSAHLRGNQWRVDQISHLAQQRAEKNGDLLKPLPVPHTLPLQDSWAVCAERDDDPTRWPITALHAYLLEHNITLPRFWDDQVAAVAEHLAQHALAGQFDPAKLTYRTAPDQPELGGFHRKLLLLDQHDREWVFKPVADDEHRFRADAEHSAHILARRWGYRTAESALITYADRYGQVQARLPVAVSLAGMTGTAFATLTTTQLCELACEHVLDWALDNDDAHGDNIVLTTDGHIVGIDKGRAWRYYGGWDGLSADTAADSNCALVYTALYDAIAAGHLDEDTVAAMYRAVIAQAVRMRQLPDDELAAIIADAVAHRPHYQPSTYQTVVAGAASNRDELIALAIARKNRLDGDMALLWQRIYDRAGLTPPDLHAGQIATNPIGQPLYTGLLEPNVHDQVARTRSYGTAVFVAGDHVEDAHVLLWRERDTDGQLLHRGQFKLRGPVGVAAEQWCRTYAFPPPEAPPKDLDNEDFLYDLICQVVALLKAKCGGLGWYHRERLDHAESMLHADTSRHREALDRGEGDPYGVHAAYIARAELYQGYITAIRRNDLHHEPLPEMPRFAWTPTVPPPGTARIDCAVACVNAYRDAATLARNPALDPDGELRLSGDELRAGGADGSMGMRGQMFVITLPTGEMITYRCAATAAPLTYQGQVEFTIPAGADLAPGLSRVVAHLAVMGVRLPDADATDLELFYWRHLDGILGQRADTRLAGERTPAAVEFHQRNTVAFHGRDEELAMWRHAFAAFTSPEQIQEFLAAGGHLPRFGHHDLRSPAQPNGKPYWERFDITHAQWGAQPMLALSYRTGPDNVVATGAALSTEGRVRHLAMWKPGMSSTDDLGYGSGAFVFARQHVQDSDSVNVLFSPRALARTSTYTFDSDRYGRLDSRPAHAYWHFAMLTSFKDSANEVLVKNSLTVLDDLEIAVFSDGKRRLKAIRHMASLGITTIRGIPVATRFIRYGDAVARRTAITAIRATYPS